LKSFCVSESITFCDSCWISPTASQKMWKRRESNPGLWICSQELWRLDHRHQVPNIRMLVWSDLIIRIFPKEIKNWICQMWLSFLTEKAFLLYSFASPEELELSRKTDSIVPADETLHYTYIISSCHIEILYCISFIRHEIFNSIYFFFHKNASCLCFPIGV
jgi:hypothetical protein